MASRRIVFLSLGACALALAVLWIALVAQAQDPSPLPAVPDVAVAPPAGRSVVPLTALPASLRAAAASRSDQAKPQRILAPSLSVTAPAASTLHHSPAPGRTAPDRAAEPEVPWGPAGDVADPLGWLPGCEPGLPGFRPSGPGVTGLSATPVITFYLTYGQVLGYTDPDSDVHLLLWRGSNQAGEARMRSDSVGYFSAELMHEGRWAAVQPGDSLDVVVNGATTTLDVPTLTGTVDAGADTVAGTIAGVPLPAELMVDCLGNRLAVTTDAAGNYLADLTGLFDISWWDGVAVSYQDADGNWLVAAFLPQDGLVVQTTYAEVVGFTDPGVVVTVTLRHGNDLATRTGRADPRHGQWYIYFDAISAGDVVTAGVGGNQIVDTVSSLTATLDLPADRVTGIGPANSWVSVYRRQSEGLRSRWAHREAATDGAGRYTADFSAVGLDAWSTTYLVHHDTPQADTMLYAFPLMAEVQWPSNAVAGYAEPGAVITATLRDGGAPIEQVTSTGRQGNGYYSAYFQTPFQPGYELAVQGGGLDVTIDLATVTAELDLEGEALYGQAPAASPLWARVGSRNFGTYFAGYTAADGSGAYELDLSAVKDVHNGAYAYAEVPQANDVDQPGWQMDYVYAPYFNLNETDNGLNGYVPAANAPVTLTLRTAGGVEKGARHPQSNATGYFSWRQFYDEDGNVIDIEPGDQVEVLVAGWSETVVAPQIDVEIDVDADRLIGTGPADSFVEVYVRYVSPILRLPTDGDGHFLADLSGLIDLKPGSEVEVALYDSNWNRGYAVGRGPFLRAELWMNTGRSSGMWGGALAGTVITVTTPRTQVTTVTGNDLNWNIADVGLVYPGDSIAVEGSPGLAPIDILVPDPFAAYASSITDTVWGQVGGWANEVLEVHGSWAEGYQEVPTDASGNYIAAYSDVPRGADGYIRYVTAVDYAQVIFHRPFRAPDLVFWVNTDGDHVQSPFELGHTVWLTLTNGSGTIKATAAVSTVPDIGWGDVPGIFVQREDWFPIPADITAGDWIYGLVDSGQRGEAHIGTITGTVDIDQDRVSGRIYAPWFTQTLPVDCHPWGGPPGTPSKQSTAGPTGDPPYSCQWDPNTEWDVLAGQMIGVFYQELDGDWIGNGFAPPYARVNVAWDAMDGWFGPSATVWYTVTDEGGAYKGGASGTARPDGWLDGIGCGCDLLPGDRVHIVSDAGYDSVLVPPAIEGQLDVDGDYASGQMSGGDFPAGGHVDLWQRSTGQWYGWDLAIEADGSFHVDLSDQVDVQPGDHAEVWYYDEAGNWLGTIFYAPFLQANVQRTHSWVNGEAWPYVTVNVDVYDSGGAYKGGGTSDTGGGTWFHVGPQKPDGSGVDIVTGDTVIVSVEGISATLPVIGLEAAVDAANDLLTGRVPDAVSYPADVHMEVWDTPTGYSEHFQTDANGDFSLDMTGRFDVRTGEQLSVWYSRPDGHRVGIGRSELRLYAYVTDDWVGDQTAPDTFVEVAISGGGGLSAVKGTASGWSDDEGYFGLEPRLVGERTDILPGDVVQATADGRSASLAIPDPFWAVYDHVANTMSGQAPAGSTLQVWIDNYPGFWIAVPEGGEWNVDYSPYGDPQIWDTVHVNYYSEDGHVARLECRIPLPDLRVDKWVEGNNQAAPGGLSVFSLRVRNDGSADADTVILTDTLPENTSYAADTSGVTPATGPGWVAWALPGLAPGEQHEFRLVLANSAEPGATLRNQADAWAEDDYDTGNNHAEAEIEVIEEQPDLYANKGASPGDPAPGQTFLWEIGHGNNRPVAAGPVTLTDTFPEGTNLVSWYSEGRPDLWEEVEAGDRLVLAAPAVPAWWHDRIILTLQVDPDLPHGTQLVNRIEIDAPDDANPDDNWQERDAWVSPPRWDAGISKSFNWGMLVPGGEAMYSVHFRNHGNMAAAVTVTDTLPAGTHFAEAWAWVGPDYVPFPPTYVDDEVAVWEVVLEPGAWINLDPRLAIDENTPSGAELTNCMSVAMAGDGYPFNDTSCVSDAVREPGPNLRLHKSAWWNGQGQLEYEIRLENVGTEELDDFEITDIYPEGTAWSSEWWVRWGPWMTATHDVPNRRLAFWVDSLSPGGTGGIGFRVDLDNPGEQGLSFFNTAHAEIAGDVYPDDNEAEATAYSGPDLFAEKWVSDGQARPGEVLTFTVRAGNANRWPWEMSEGADLILSDHLPEGMSLVAATWPEGSPVEPFFYDPGSGLVMFNLGRMGSDDWRWFFLSTELDADLGPGEVLVNRLEVQEWPALDIDPIPGNNSFDLTVAVEGMRVFLPIVLKNY